MLSNHDQVLLQSINNNLADIVKLLKELVNRNNQPKGSEDNAK